MKKVILLALSLFAVAPAFAGGEAYYQQFMYAKEEIDDGDEGITVVYHNLMSFLNEIEINPNRIMVVNMSLFLLPDSQYALTYQEDFKVRANADAPWGFEPGPTGFCPKVIRGAWSAPDQQLVTNEGFHADRAVFNGHPAVKIVFDRPLVSAEPVGREFIADYGFSMSPMEMATNRPFCR